MFQMLCFSLWLHEVYSKGQQSKTSSVGPILKPSEAIHPSRCLTAIFSVTLPDPFVLVRKAAPASNWLALITYAYHMDQFLVCCQGFCAKPALPGESHLHCACTQEKGGKSHWISVLAGHRELMSCATPIQGSGILDGTCVLRPVML